MAPLISSCWLFLTNCLLFLIKFIAQHSFRIKINDSSQKSTEDSSMQVEHVPETNEIEERNFSGFHVEEEEEEDEPSTFSFKFEHQIPKIITGINEEPSVLTTEDNFQDTTTNISNSYCFFSEKKFSGFVEQPAPMTFRVHESFVNHNEEKSESRNLSIESFEKSSIQQSEDTIFMKNQNLEERKQIEYQNTKPLVSEKQITVSFSGFDSDSESTSLSDDYSLKTLVIDSESDGILSEDFGERENFIDFSALEEELEQDLKKIEEDQCSSSSDEFLSEKLHYFDEREIEQSHFLSTNKFKEDLSSSSSDVFLSEKLHDLKEGEIIDTQILSSSDVQIEFSSNEHEVLGETELIKKIFDLNPEVIDGREHVDEEPRRDGGNSEERKEEDMKRSEETQINDLNPECTDGTKQVDEELGRNTGGCAARREEDMEKSEENQMNDLDEEEEDELESLWEHQDLVEQLRMEIKRAKAVGLPTIFEESESEKAVEDLKPWKIDDEKFFGKDPMDELHKFYKSYSERMRKFDILNYQKMYAIGFLQTKKPLESIGAHKPLMPAIFSHLSQYLKPFYPRKSSTDPSENFIKELRADLETVYVGQMCLSWEFLRWQYEKARELPDSDPYRSHQYNQVAGEFQHFQVILQRFIENGSFQGPRLQNYVETRCMHRDLLQIPVIKEDCLKDKMEGKQKGKYAITSEMLEDIMEESIALFWEFVKAEKDETSTILKGLIGHQVELQDPSDFSLMAKIQKSIQKKEKKLRDTLKTGNCLVKKFKKPREDRSNQDLFFSQVDMKLISRVLKMSRITTEQLVWCHHKLSKITLKDLKIHRKQSFLLFPC